MKRDLNYKVQAKLPQHDNMVGIKVHAKAAFRLWGRRLGRNEGLDGGNNLPVRGGSRRVTSGIFMRFLMPIRNGVM